MHEIDKNKIIRRYKNRINDFGHGSAALGEPKNRQGFYFDILTNVEGFQKSDSILDLGCGYGDLYAFLQSRGHTGVYFGIDINPDLIDEGKRLYPNAFLEVRDIQISQIDYKVDWCICCQALTSSTETVAFKDHIESMLNLSWNICKKGLLFNVLSPYVDYTHPVHARPQIAMVLDVITKLTNRFIIRHDYMPYEYAVYAYRDNDIDPELHIFKAQKKRFNKTNDSWKKR